MGAKLLSPTGDESFSLPDLPEELILEILLRVPVRYLLQFRRVCKKWKTLISDPQFAKDHLRTSTADPNMTHQRLFSSIVGDPKIELFSVPSLFENPSTPAKGCCFMTSDMYHILGSCNGLLCLCDIHQRYLTLWNPSIRFTSKRLPTGVSVSPSTVIQNFPRQRHPTECLGKFVSGTLNWMAARGGTETYGEVLLPDGDNDKICNPVLNVLRNCLCVCFFDSKKAHWVVWLMKKYGVHNSWTKFMMIPHFIQDPWTRRMTTHVQHGSFRSYHSLDPLCISEDGVVILKTNFSHVVLYNSNDGSLHYPRIRDEYGLHHLHIYHESLVSPSHHAIAALVTFRFQLDWQNDHIWVLETIAKRPKLVSSTGDESPLLPEELVLEILLRVPVRSLLRFKCICRSWKILISDSQFVKYHLRTSTAHPNMAHQHLVSPIFGNSKMVSDSVQSLFRNPPSTPAEGHCFKMNDNYCILGSCNGLLCLCHFHQRYVTLWNPSIRLTSKRLSTGLVRPGASIIHNGFGYDHVNDTYKLVVAVEDHHETVTKVYSFGANSWKMIQNFPCRPTRGLGKFVSGTLNWIAKRGVADDDRWVILSLDLGTETYGEVLLPDGDGDNICIPVLAVLVLSCVSFFDSKKAHWVVWLMKEYGLQDSWTKLMTIPLFIEGDPTWNNLITFPLKWFHSLNPLCISENGVVILEANLSQVVLYNLNDGRLDYPRFSRELGLHGLQIYHEVWFHHHVKITLPSLKLLYISDG
ncbi:F-box/kelch-repeat protein [Spatholobus suberectus]|nr:F-box/kelch-repeat protein [Spatholobus suberectus]